MCLRILALALGLALGLVAADVRARDPEVEEEPQQANSWKRLLYGAHGSSPYRTPLGHSPMDAGHAQHPLGHGHGHQPEHLGSPTHDAAVETVPPTGEAETQHSSTRIGNWCSYISYRVVTKKVACGTEKYTIQSQSPCPNGSPDCHLVMYKLSVRPVYREVPKISSSQLWKCCPGHGGKNCEDTVTQEDILDVSNQTGSFHPVPSEVHHRADERQASQLAPHHLEPGDFQASEHFKEENSTSPEHHHTPSDPYIHHLGHDHDHDHHKTVEMDPSLLPLPLPYAGEPMSLPHIETMLMARLQPLLDGFNRTLQRLSQEVGDLSQDLAEIKQSQAEPRPHMESTEPSDGYKALETRLEYALQHMNQMGLVLRSQRDEMEDRIHSQQATLHYNLTNLKMDTDSKIKRSQKMMQVSLQHLNTSLAEVQLHQVRLEEEVQRGSGERSSPGLRQTQVGSAVWEAINRLDNKVINNTLKVDDLLEHLGLVRKSLYREYLALEERVTKDGREVKVQNMLNGLEIEDLKSKLWNRISELAENVTEHESELREMNVDMDYLFQQFHKNVSSATGDCSALKASLSKLEQDVAKVSELANENRLALEDSSDTQGTLDVTWSTSLDDLRADLLQVQKTLGSEQHKSHLLYHNLSQLHSDLLGDIHSLREKDAEREGKMNHLSNNFESLKMDGVRHSEVLEILLEEEVIDFKDRPLDKQKTYSIPMLQEKIHTMQEHIRNQNLSMHSLRMSIQAEDPDAVYEPLVLTEESSRGLKRTSRDHRGDLTHSLGNDLHSLEKAVENVRMELSKLKHERCLSCCNCTDKTDPMGPVEELQSEVAMMRKALQEHLHVFKNVFSNMDVLANTDEILDVEQLWAMVKKKEERWQGKDRQQKKSQSRGSQNGRKMSQQNRRDNSPQSGKD